jgi:hypothetical protein
MIFFIITLPKKIIEGINKTLQPRNPDFLGSHKVLIGKVIALVLLYGYLLFYKINGFESKGLIRLLCKNFPRKHLLKTVAFAGRMFLFTRRINSQMSCISYLLYMSGQVSPNEALRGSCSHPAGYDAGKRRPCLPLLYHFQYTYTLIRVKLFFKVAAWLRGILDTEKCLNWIL